MFRFIVIVCCLALLLATTVGWSQAPGKPQASGGPTGATRNLPHDDPVRFLPDYVEIIVSFPVPKREAGASPEQKRARALEETAAAIGGNSLAAFLSADQIDADQQAMVASFVRSGIRFICGMWDPQSAIKGARRTGSEWDGVLLVVLERGTSVHALAEKANLAVHKSESGQPVIYVQQSSGDGPPLYAGIIGERTAVIGKSAKAVEAVVANSRKEADDKPFYETWNAWSCVDFTATFWAVRKQRGPFGGERRVAGIGIWSGKKGDALNLTFVFPNRKELIEHLGKEFNVGDLLEDESLEKLGMITYGAPMSAKVATHSTVNVEILNRGRGFDAALASIATILGIGARE